MSLLLSFCPYWLYTTKGSSMKRICLMISPFPGNSFCINCELWSSCRRERRDSLWRGLFHGLKPERRSRLDRLPLHAAQSENGVLKLEAKVTEQAFCSINHQLLQLAPGSCHVYQHKKSPSGERHESTWDRHVLRCSVPHLALGQRESIPSRNFARLVKVMTNYLQMAS